MQGMDEEGLERLMQLHLHIVSISLKVLMNITWSIPFNTVYCCI
jgi:hypothetical protein